MDTTKQQALYKRLRANGICTRCRKMESGPMFACWVCRTKQADALRRIYQRRIERGLCGRCGKQPSVEGFRRCADCRGEGRNIHSGDGLGEYKFIEGEANE